jgi:hypothetical protein
MKTSEVIQDNRVCRGIELDSDHYLLYAKINFSPHWVNKNKKKFSVRQEEFFKIRLLHDESIKWLYTQRVKL